MIMKSNFSKYTYNNGKRNIGGTAAYNHFFKEHGGIDNVINQIVYEATRKATLSAVQKILKTSK